MQSALPYLLFVIGAAIGAGGVWLWLRGRDQTLQAVLRERDAQLAEAKSALEREQARVDAADQKAELAQRELSSAKAIEAALKRDLEAERNLAREKLAAFQQAEERLRDAFKSLTTDALKNSSEQFLKLAEENLKKLQEAGKGDLEQRQKAVETLVKPIRESLDKVNTQVQELEKVRAQAYGSLTEQVKSLALSQQKLETETGNLVKALRQPQQRGQWGELQLDNVLKAAGLRPGLDYDKQPSMNVADGRLRPDVVVRLPDGGQLVIDAKAPVDAFLRAYEAPDEEQRLAHLRDHVRLVKNHIAALSSKEYWGQFTPSPEFVVMFLPGEAFFSAALEQDPDLITRSVEQRVILASPITLIAMLRAVAYGWRQKKIEEQVEEIGRLGADLYDRLGVLADHFGKVGDSLGRATKSYNDAVGSLERNVLSSARRMKELGAPGKRELLTVEPVEETVREIQAKELRKAAKE